MLKMGRALQHMKITIGENLPLMLEKWPLDVFIICSVICFLGSSAMHLFWVKSLRACHLTHNIDLSGISLMIFGSAYGLVYYIFKCDQVAYYIYVALLVLSLIGILICINCKILNKAKWQNLKVMLFLLQGCVAATSVLHWKLMK